MIKQVNKDQSVNDFNTFVKPLLIDHGWQFQAIENMLFRIRWGKNYANWTVRITDQYPTDVPVIEASIRTIICGQHIENKWVVEAFLPEPGQGPVLSYGVIQLYDLATAIYNADIPVINKENINEGVSFSCFSFYNGLQFFGNRCVVFM